MEERVALVAGGLRGMGRARGLGWAGEGHPVLGLGHIAEDLPEIERAAAQLPGRLQPLVADLRETGECDRVVAAARDRFGRVDILVNCAGLTFTYIDPPRFRRPTIQRFYEVGDEIIDNVVAVNLIAADRLSRRVAPAMVAAGLGRLVTVTPQLDTMNPPATHPHRPAKARLAMAHHGRPRDA